MMIAKGDVNNMTLNELIKQCKKFDNNTEVLVYDKTNKQYSKIVHIKYDKSAGADSVDIEFENAKL